eukprot:TRINITY_DN8869_c0_g1_i1.p1 TRINITY_DN8869_c0_g1~~TRINITY_DN8869_c0_g1_i1.p1  ORF type:complete len:272 (+),score=62.54 TRINITY_DN8869_c0_g1_i1:58-873(+)
MGDSAERKAPFATSDAAKTNDGPWWRPLSYSPSNIDARLHEAAIYEDEGKLDEAIQVYQHAVSHADVTSSEGLPLLTKCLNRLARLYAKKEQYQIAVQYAQAEKLIYERALLDIEEHDVQYSPEHNVSHESEHEQDPKRRAALQKAESLERLSRILLNSNSSELALEYAYQAINIRMGLGQDIKSIPESYVESLGAAYALEGKRAYNDALMKYVSSKTDAKAQQTDPIADKDSETTDSFLDSDGNNHGTQWLFGALLALFVAVVAYIVSIL